MTFISSASERRATSDPMPPIPRITTVAPRRVPTRKSGRDQSAGGWSRKTSGSPLAAASIWAKTHSPINSPLMPREQVSVCPWRASNGKLSTPVPTVCTHLGLRPSRSARLGPPSVRVNTTSPSMSGGISPSRGHSTTRIPGHSRTWGGSGNSLWLMTTVSVVSDMAPDRTRGDPRKESEYGWVGR